MGKTTKVWVTISSCLIGAGLIMTGIGLATGANHSLSVGPKGIQTVEYSKEKKQQEADTLEAFSSVYLDTSFCDIQFVPADEFGYEIIYYREEKKPSITVEDGQLNVILDQAKQNQSWTILNFGDFDMSSQNPNIKIYYPKGTQLTDISGKLDYADIQIEQMLGGSLDLEADFSDIKMTDVVFEDMNLNTSYGSNVIRGMTAKDVTIRHDFTDYSWADCKLNSLDSTSSYGEFELIRSIVKSGAIMTSDFTDIEITGELLGESSFENEYGELDLELLDIRNYSYQVDTDMSDFKLLGKTLSDGMKDSNSAAGNSGNMITVNSSFTDVSFDEYNDKNIDTDHDDWDNDRDDDRDD